MAFICFRTCVCIDARLCAGISVPFFCISIALISHVKSPHPVMIRACARCVHIC